MSALSTLIPTPTPPQASVPPTPEVTETQRFVLEGVSWDEYELFLKGCGERPGLRLTYDGWSLEFMTTSGTHERWKVILHDLLMVLGEELIIPICSFGEMTCRRASARGGLEPDDCYYIQNVPAIQGVLDIDLTQHPPPDLAIEIEYSRSVLDRLSIYARLRVPEVWRFDGGTITVLVLQVNGEYLASPTSLCLPLAPLAEMARLAGLVGQTGPTDNVSLMRQFRQWVRQNIVLPPLP